MKQGTQATKINQLVLGGFGIIIILTGITNFISKSVNDSLSEANDWVIHTEEVKGNLLSINNIIVDAETGQRWFIITNKEKYLEPYISANKEIEQVIAKTKEKISDNPKQVGKLTEVEILVDKKFDELAETISLKKAGKEKEEAENAVDSFCRRYCARCRCGRGKGWDYTACWLDWALMFWRLDW